MSTIAYYRGKRTSSRPHSFHNLTKTEYPRARVSVFYRFFRSVSYRGSTVGRVSRRNWFFFPYKRDTRVINSTNDTSLCVLTIENDPLDSIKHATPWKRRPRLREKLDDFFIRSRNTRRNVKWYFSGAPRPMNFNVSVRRGGPVSNRLPRGYWNNF